MNVVDSSAWLSYFAGDKNAGAFAKPIEAIDELLVPSLTLTEVFKCIMRQRLGSGAPPPQLWHRHVGTGVAWSLLLCPSA